MTYTTQQLIHFNHCSCGWWFPALSPLVTKCPQCRDEQRLCVQCGEAITGRLDKKFCDNCLKDRRNIKQKYAKRDKILKEKYTFSDRKNLICDNRICDYDCANCKFSECLLPVDKDDYYDKETIKMFEEKIL